jgi:hypothetical protein
LEHAGYRKEKLVRDTFRKHPITASLCLLLGLGGMLLWARASWLLQDPGVAKPLASAWGGPMFLLPDSSACPFSEHDSAQFLFTQPGSLVVDVGGDVVCTFSYRTFSDHSRQMLELRGDSFTHTYTYTYTIEGNRLTLESAAHDRYRYTWKPSYRDPASW